MDFWYVDYFGQQFGWLIALAIAVGINIPLFVWVRIRRHLTLGGCFWGALIGISLFMVGPLFYIVLLTFFISSSILTKFKSSKKKEIQDKFDKGGERDASQVLANGLPGLIFAAGHVWLYTVSQNIVLSNALVYAYIASFATTNADTWATEIGVLSKVKPHWILDLRKRVDKGTSGGISKVGTLASLAGSMLVASIALIVEVVIRNPIPPESSWQKFLFIPLAGIGGFIGCFIDSLLGATVQGFFKCQVCDKGTEKRIHCNKKTILQRGNPTFRNDAVNIFAALLSGFLVFGISCFAFLL
jgi:uncharacterized protein (TIGR00297 family)